MQFSVTLHRTDAVEYDFNGDQINAYNDSEEEPTPIFGEIHMDGRKIGEFTLYELYNDTDFWRRCDAVSGDCASIAAKICGKSGAVLKKYLPEHYEYQAICILDNITIEKNYRGQGIGSAVVKNLLRMVTYQFEESSVLFLCASDFEAASQYGFDSPEYRDGKNRLIRFYSSLGFRPIQDNIMVYRKTGN